MSVLVETSLGVIVIDLYVKERPKCSLNFLKLCQLKYFNFCLFHSVQKNLVAQTGDPTGTGRGGASIFQTLYGEQARYFDVENKPKITHTLRGLVSMVNNGCGQHGSQFFITLGDELDYLDKKHTVFGYIAEGKEFIDKINDVYCDKDNRPFRNVRIHHTIVLDDPFDTPKELIFPESPQRFPIPSFSELGPPRIEEDEVLDEEVGLSPLHQEELKAEQEATTHAQLLTLIGDLPDPNVKPPDNVLFVCRLNPVTTAEDLEIIFSRFGEIKCCEVIRDKRTSASLQYAFIEFANETDCENAFFKMDKVVIDDRRIHVDFSQSVAKEWRKHKENEVSQTIHKPPTKRRIVEHRSTVSRGSEFHRSRSSHRSHRHSPVKQHRSKNRRERPEVASSEELPLIELPSDGKHEPLVGADLDLVISEGDSSDSSCAAESGGPRKHTKERKRKKHSHGSRSCSPAEKNQHHHKRSKPPKHRHKQHESSHRH